MAAKNRKKKKRGELHPKSTPAALIVMRILRKENNGLMNMCWFTRQYYYLQKKLTNYYAKNRNFQQSKDASRLIKKY